MSTFPAVILFAVAMLLAGCSLAGPGSGSLPEGQSATGVAATSGGGTVGSVVDPQILSDVIDWAFFLPGPSMRRAMRLERAKVSIEAVDCGLAPYKNLDETNDRYDQGTFPDLELIAAKNLVETGAEEKKPDFVSVDPDAKKKEEAMRAQTTPPQPGDELKAAGDIPCRYKSLPSWPAVTKLDDTWESDVALEVLNSDAMRDVKMATAKCLRAKSGLDASDADPTNSWMNSADYYLSGLATNAAWAKAEARLSKDFVACAGDFAAKMKELLSVKRTQYVERNRELLERFARELSAAGYVP